MAITPPDSPKKKFDLDTFFQANHAGLTADQLIQYFLKKAEVAGMDINHEEGRELLKDLIDEAVLAVRAYDRPDLINPLLKWVNHKKGRMNIYNPFLKSTNCWVLLEDHVELFGHPGHPDFTNAIQKLLRPEYIDDPVVQPGWFKTDSDRRRVIHIAIEEGNQALFDFCLSRGADPRGEPDKNLNLSHTRETITGRFDRYQITPLELAVRHGRLGMARTLLEKGHPQNWRFSNNLEQAPGAGPAALELGAWPMALLLKKAGGRLQLDSYSKRGDAVHPTPSPTSRDDARLWLVATTEQYLDNRYTRTEPETRRPSRGIAKLFKRQSEMTQEEADIHWMKHHHSLAHAGIIEGNPDKLRQAIDTISGAENWAERWPGHDKLAFWAVSCCIASFDGEVKEDGTMPPRLKRLACLRYLVKKAQEDSPMGCAIAQGFSHETHHADGLNLLHWAVLMESPEVFNILQESGLVPSQSSFDLSSPGIIALEEKSWMMARLALVPETIQSFPDKAASPLEVAWYQDAPDDLRDFILEQMTPEQKQTVIPQIFERYHRLKNEPKINWLEKQLLLLENIPEKSVPLCPVRRL